MHDIIGKRRRMAGRHLALLLAFLAPLPLAAQYLAPGVPLFVARTASFDIYYPAALEAEAARLAGFADATRKELEPRFAVEAARGRIAVLLADGQADVNGFYTVAPSDRIVLFLQAPVLGETLGNFDDNLASLFRHELSHYLSLSGRPGLWKLLDILCGDTASPAYTLAPLSMVEGASVSAESDGGHGRLQDPEALSIVSQSLIEGRRPTFWQASGARDLYPFSSQYYLFGGAFTAWLRARHGDAAYADFWKRLSEGNPLVGLEPGLFSRGVFAIAFGETLENAWRAFLTDATPENRPPDLSRRLAKKPGAITAMAAGEACLYVADASRGAILRLDPATCRPQVLLESDGSVNALSLSADGGTLLVSASVAKGGGGRLFVRAFDLAARRWSGEPIWDLREASWIGSARGEGDLSFVAVAPRGLDTDLVLVSETERRVLARGGTGLAFGSPKSADGQTIWAIGSDRGEKHVMRFSASAALAADGLPEGTEWLRLPDGPLSVKDLELGPEGLAFSCALALDQTLRLPGLALYRPATLDPESGVLRLAGKLFSGGVNRPVRTRDGGLYYVGRFASGDFPCEGPGEAGFGWVATTARFEAARPSSPATLAADTGAATGAARAASAEDKAGNGAEVAAARMEPASALPLLLDSIRLPWLGTDLASAGLVMTGEDLTGRFAWTAQTGWSWGAGGADLALDLTFKCAPFVVGLSLEDAFVPGAEGLVWYRQSRALARADASFNGWPSRVGLSASAFAGFSALSEARPGTPYDSDWKENELALGLGLGTSDLRSTRFPPFLREGYALSATVDLEKSSALALPSLSAGLSAEASSSLLRSRLSLWGLASLEGSPRYATSGRIFVTDDHRAINAGLGTPWPAYREYAELRYFGSLYAQGEVETLVLPVEIQAGLAPGIYLRRVELEAGARGAWIGGKLAAASNAPAVTTLGGGVALASAYLGVTADFSLLVGFRALMALKPRVELAYAFLPGYTGDSPLSSDFTLGVSY